MKSDHKTSLYASISMLCIALATAVQAKATYVKFNVRGSELSIAQFINNNGEVAGPWNDNDDNAHGFVRASDGTISTFDPPNSLENLPTGMNDSGIVVGFFNDTSNESHGYWRMPDGTITVYDAPNGGQGDTFIDGINSSGTMVGESGGDLPAFILDSQGQIVQFTYGTGFITQLSINDSGTVTGWYSDSNNQIHGLVRATDGTVTIFDPPGSTKTIPTGIDSRNEVCGYFLDGNNLTHGFIRKADGTITVVDEPDAADGQTFVNGINGLGTLVGYYTAADGLHHAFTRSPKGKFKNFIIGHEKAAGTRGWGINDEKAVVGTYGTTKGDRDYVRIPAN